MRSRLPLSLVSILFAACQSANDDIALPDAWRSQMETAQQMLERDVERLWALESTRAAPTDLITLGGGGSIDDQTTALIAQLAELGEQLARLGDAIATPGAARATDASHTPTEPPAQVELLSRTLAVLQRQAALHCENISYANVTGYRARSLELGSTLHEPSGLQVPVGGRTILSTAPGTLHLTDRNLDVAIDGEGFFVARAPSGDLHYTRAGNLMVDPEGRLATSVGHVIEPVVTLPEDTLEIVIDAHGSVTGRRASSIDTRTTFGAVSLARFRSPEALQPTRDGSFYAVPEVGPRVVAAPGSAGCGTLKQGFLEGSNVELTSELVQLQSVMRQHATVRRVLASHGYYTR